MRQLILTLFMASTLAPVSVGQTANWPQYRGADSDGLAEGATLPETWSATENVVWKADIPGWGWSSPVIWGGKIFVTSAVGENKLERPVIGGYPGGRVKPTDIHRWMTYCLDFELVHALHLEK